MMMATPAALPSTSMQIIMQQQQQQQQPHGSQHNQHIPYASTSTYLPPPSPVVSSSYYAPPHHPQLHPHHRLSLHHPHRHAPSLAMDAVLRPNNDAFHIIKKSQRGRPSTKNPNQSSEKKQYPCDWDDDGRQPRCPKVTSPSILLLFFANSPSLRLLRQLSRPPLRPSYPSPPLTPPFFRVSAVNPI